MTSDHWNEHAKQWSYVGPPLRPCMEDIALIESTIDQHVQQDTELEVVILGVTPELALLNWPIKTNLVAIDRNQAMIDGVWPQSQLNVKAQALSGDWLSTPFDTISKDIVLGDGCFTLLSFHEHFKKFLQEVQRITKPDGLFIIRHFCRPEKKESLDNIFSDLLAGHIGNFHVFKWRLAMALHGTIEEGVIVGQIWDEWNARNIDSDELAAQLDWQTESINTINNYRQVDSRYSFPTVKEISELSSQYFNEQACFFMDYELGDRCPTFVYSPK